MDNTFDPQTLANDLTEVHRIYARFFDSLDKANWDQPVKGGPKEWTLHETIAHLCALSGAGIESIQHALRGETYVFNGLANRYMLNAYNRSGIDQHLHIPMEALFAEFLDIHNEAANITRTLQPDQAERTVQMPIYNRPVRITEALSIIMVHTGLFHSAQVTEPASLPPLWMQLSSEIRHRVIGRTMRAFSLLYRLDIGGSLHEKLVFRVDGPGGGEWYVELSPEAPTSGEGSVDHPKLVIHQRDTAILCQFLTGRLNLPIALITGAMQLRGDLRLFLRMNTLFSVDARPKVTANANITSTPWPQIRGRSIKMKKF